MSDNNTMYRLFRQMIQGYKLGDEGNNLFVHAVHCWMGLNPDNPFPEDSEAFDYFFRAKNYYNVWKMHSADQRISERRMINEARALCATKPKNPYKFDKKAAEEEKAILRETAKKEQEEAINLQNAAEKEKAEREAEIQAILDEIRQDDLENQNEILNNRAIVEEAKAEVIKQQIKEESAVEASVVEATEKKYVFNVQENPQEKPKEKKGWLSRLLKR